MVSIYYIFLNIFTFSFFSFKIPDVTERLRRDSVGRASNLVFTIWAVFGGFILHFLLSNYLTVLLKPTYEEPVETAEDLLKRNITPFLFPGSDIYRQLFAASPDPNYQEISRRLVIAKDYEDYEDMVRSVTLTGMFAEISTTPWWFNSTREYEDWYRSSETIDGDNPFSGHLANKKWPLRKVL